MRGEREGESREASPLPLPSRSLVLFLPRSLVPFLPLSLVLFVSLALVLSLPLALDLSLDLAGVTVDDVEKGALGEPKTRRQGQSTVPGLTNLVLSLDLAAPIVDDVGSVKLERDLSARPAARRQQPLREAQRHSQKHSCHFRRPLAQPRVGTKEQQ